MNGAQSNLKARRDTFALCVALPRVAWAAAAAAAADKPQARFDLVISSHNPLTLRIWECTWHKIENPKPNRKSQIKYTLIFLGVPKKKEEIFETINAYANCTAFQ